MSTNIEKHVPRVMTSLLMSFSSVSISHRFFRCWYSNFRDVVASSPSFSLPPPERPGELARRLRNSRPCYLDFKFNKQQKFATPCNTNSSKIRITQLSDSSEQRQSAPNLFHNQNFNVQALELKFWALDRNFDKSVANVF